METDRDKRVTAAVAAVMAYLQQEREALGPGEAPKERGERRPPGYWGVSGRQAQMQQRTLMQLRTFK